MQRPADHPCYTAVELHGSVVAMHAAARMPVKPRPPQAPSPELRASIIEREKVGSLVVLILGLHFLTERGRQVAHLISGLRGDSTA
jgi:hypothetical protein